jgi:AcrR family transcriptional regulator
MRELRSKQTASDAAAGVRKRQYKTARKRRREITTATLEILSEQGMHAWTTSALAARVGVSEATLFRHFRSKDEILISAFRDLVQSIKSRVAEFDGPGAPWERVRGLVFHVLDFVQETGGGPLIIMTGEAIRILPAVREDVLETRLLFRDKLIELVQDALVDVDRQEELRAGDVADLIIAVVHSTGLRWVLSDGTISLRETAGRMLDVVAHYWGGREVEA